MKWTQKELEALYQKANKTGKEDLAFREAFLKDPKGTLEKLAGRELPEEFTLEAIESDPRYQGAYFVPSFLGDEVDMNSLTAVVGGDMEEQALAAQEESVSDGAVGISIALIVSVCSGAANPSCGADVNPSCGADVNPSCGADVNCSADGYTCGWYCNPDMCGADSTCAENIGPVELVCAGDACLVDGFCMMDLCAEEGAPLCPVDFCAANACDAYAGI